MEPAAVLSSRAGALAASIAQSWLSEHWLAVALVAAGAVVGAAAIGVLARYGRLAVNVFLDTPLPMTVRFHDYDAPHGEIVSFPSRDGRSLRGMLIDRPPGRPDRGTILFCHEFASDMLSAGRYARPLVDAGYTVFTFDFRGHGRSFVPPHWEARHWPSHHEVNDILAAIAYLRSRRDIDATGLGVHGISRGASAAIVAAAIGRRIRCLAVDGAFSTDYTIEGLIKRWAQIFSRINLARANHPAVVYRFMRALVMFYVELKLRCRFPSTRKALAKLEDVPVLFISGERDTYVQPEQTQVLYDLKPGPKELWVCPEAKHNQAVATEPETYARKLVAFFDRHLAGVAAGTARAGDKAEPAAEARAARQMAG